MSSGINTEISSDGADQERTEEPLRPLTVRDWLIGSLCGAGLAVIMFIAASFSVPEPMIIPLAVIGFGLGILAYFDHVTHLILDTHNLAFLALAAASLFIPASAGYITWGPAAVGFGIVFLFMLTLAVVANYVGGGDIKLAPIPAAVLSVASPLAACMWLCLTFMACLAYQIAAKVEGQQKKFVAMAPFMAIALVPSFVISNSVMASMGLQ